MPRALSIQGVLNDGIVTRDFGAPFMMNSLDLNIVECPGYVTALRLYSAGPAAPNNLVAMSVTCEYAVQRADASGNAGSVWLGSVTNASVTPVLVRPPASDSAIVNPPGVRSLQVAATADRILGLGAYGQHYGSLDDKATVWQQDQDKNVKSCPLASIVMLVGDKKYAQGLKLSFWCPPAVSISTTASATASPTATPTATPAADAATDRVSPPSSSTSLVLPISLGVTAAVLAILVASLLLYRYRHRRGSSGDEADGLKSASPSASRPGSVVASHTRSDPVALSAVPPPMESQQSASSPTFSAAAQGRALPVSPLYLPPSDSRPGSGRNRVERENNDVLYLA
ncbi:hypothetical protein GGF31_007619 [Allomyces arbusculus]|nr:hypothetical protein GGF31_007619 [Allomyces arbusculus]